jgi:hypothetical protein
VHEPLERWDPPKRNLRHAAWLAAFVLAVLAWQLDSSPLQVAAALVFAVGTVLPGTLRWPCFALLTVLRPLGRLGSWLSPLLHSSLKQVEENDPPGSMVRRSARP